jgi:sirohydrochlorin ferrochelatase
VTATILPSQTSETGLAEHRSLSDSAVLLIGHGSPDPRHRRAVQAIGQLLDQVTAARVAVGFLEHDSPSAAEALAAGFPERQVFVLPLLLTAGMHWRRDIPPLVAGPGQRVHLLAPPPLPQFVDAIAESADNSNKGTVVVAMAGSRRPEFPRRAAELRAVVAQRLPDHQVTVALDPAAVAEHAHPDALVVPLVIGEGVLGDRIAAAAAAADAEVAHPVGASTTFATVLAHHLSQYRPS